MFERCHCPDDVTMLYLKLGFPTELLCRRVTLVANSKLSAVVTPAEIGHRARQLLGGADSAMPIIRHGRGQPWVFVVGPNRGRGYSARSLGDLDLRGIRLLSSGQRVWLPMSDAHTGWYWAAPLVHATQLPARTTVLNAARMALTTSASTTSAR